MLENPRSIGKNIELTVFRERSLRKAKFANDREVSVEEDNGITFTCERRGNPYTLVE